MRYPEFLKDRGTIGFVAPSMGCTTEPYRSAFDNAIKRFHSMGYKTIEGPNCRCDSGIGISNTPKKCAEELNESYASVDSDVLISCCPRSTGSSAGRRPRSCRRRAGCAECCPE